MIYSPFFTNISRQYKCTRLTPLIFPQDVELDLFRGLVLGFYSYITPLVIGFIVRVIPSFWFEENAQSNMTLITGS